MRVTTSDTDRLTTYTREHATAILGDGSVADNHVGHGTGAVKEMHGPNEDGEFVVIRLWRNHG